MIVVRCKVLLVSFIQQNAEETPFYRQKLHSTESTHRATQKSSTPFANEFLANVYIRRFNEEVELVGGGTNDDFAVLIIDCERDLTQMH